MTRELTLWTIQHTAAWSKAERTGILKADGRRIPKEVRPAYHWMIEQMRRRIPGYSGAFPIWADPEARPDLRKKQFATSGTLGVRVEFVADPSIVLISELSMWDGVVTGTYCGLTEEDERGFNKGHETFNAWLDWRQDPERAALIRQSWDRIFEIDLLRANSEWCGDYPLQATVGQVALSQVTEVTRFVSK